MPHTMGTQARSKISLYTGFERELLMGMSVNFATCRPETSPISRNFLILK
jgi:hypothetical protein